MTDRELLEFAAKAAGYQVARIADNDDDLMLFGVQEIWNPLAYDGDALRLAEKLGLTVNFSTGNVYGPLESPRVHVIDGNRKRAIVLAAADIGKAMP